jgi:transcriptional regulator with XRE-family HTH domain
VVTCFPMPIRVAPGDVSAKMTRLGGKDQVLRNKSWRGASDGSSSWRGYAVWKAEIRRFKRGRAPTSPVVNIGQSLAALRRDRELTLMSAAALCSVSAATLSRIENGNLSPSFDIISNICAGFGIGIREFLSYGSRTKVSGWRDVTRSGAGRIIETPHYRFELLGDDIAQKPFIVLRAEILVRRIEDFGPLQSHPGHEQIVVQSGEIEVWIEHYAPAQLKAGDSLAFDSALGHAVISIGQEPATVLWICDAQEIEP